MLASDQLPCSRFAEARPPSSRLTRSGGFGARSRGGRGWRAVARRPVGWVGENNQEYKTTDPARGLVPLAMDCRPDGGGNDRIVFTPVGFVVRKTSDPEVSATEPEPG